MHANVKSPFLLIIAALLFACGRDEPKVEVIGTLSYSHVHKSFIQDQGPVRFVDLKECKPSILAITPNIDPSVNSGNRLSFICERDFGIEITLEDIPEGSYFTTAFGISKEAEPLKERLSAEYSIQLDGKVVKRRKIDSFLESRDRIWYEEELDLENLAGKDAKILLTAEVQPRDEGVVRGWSEPLLKLDKEVPWTKASSERPNILLILVDTLRAENLGCYGYERDTSPNLDAFAARSLLFENAVAPSSWTWPSTASVLTGQYPLHHGVLDAKRCTLPLEKRTLAEACADAGMYTGGFVANSLISESKRFDQGFMDFDVRPSPRAELVFAAFSAWIEKVKKGRFFAYLHFMDPHHPFNPSKEFIAKFSDPNDNHRLSEKEFGKLRGQVNLGVRKPSEDDRAAVKNALDRYDAEIFYWDVQFGRILKVLEDLGLLDKTIVAVVSDHGEAFLENDVIGHGHHLYDTCLWIPLIIGGPGFESGRVKEQVELVSIMPTLLEAARIDPGGAEFDRPSLLGKEALDESRLAFTHTEHAFQRKTKERYPIYSVRTLKWKYHYDSRTHRLKLFDLEEDPGERNNLMGTPPSKEVCRRLHKYLEACIKEYKAKSPALEFEVDEETIKALQELGYIGD